MKNDEATVAEMLPEPEDGTVLVVNEGYGRWQVIWRDDAAAKSWGGHPQDRWFHASDEDPMSLHAQAKDAESVYVLGAEVAAFWSR